MGRRGSLMIPAGEKGRRGRWLITLAGGRRIGRRGGRLEVCKQDQQQ
jgi:hypothetical protein